ncbi:hypothetical protein ScPMuIL_017002 [Solemya velum]
MAQDDPILIKAIQEIWIDPPSELPHNFSDPLATSHGLWDEDLVVDGLLNHREDGFFIEAGAVDGEAASNSFFFEVKRKWRGLLVEPDPTAYTMLKSKHRHAYSINSCLSDHASTVTIGQKTVDYFSLDVEGSEPAVLRSIPFDKVDIKLLTIQWIHCGKKVIRDILEPAGYHLAKEIEADVIYVKNS